jgi:hypothetical protein
MNGLASEEMCHGREHGYNGNKEGRLWIKMDSLLKIKFHDYIERIDQAIIGKV